MFRLHGDELGIDPAVGHDVERCSAMCDWGVMGYTAAMSMLHRATASDAAMATSIPTRFAMAIPPEPS
jgi:hypothetical protein